MVLLATEENEGGMPSLRDALVSITGERPRMWERRAPKKTDPTIADAKALDEYLFLDIATPPCFDGE